MQERVEVLKIDPDYPEREKIIKAADFIKKGKVVVFLMKEIYGLGVDILNPEAIEQIFELKKITRDKSVSIFISNFDDLERLSKDIPQQVWKVIDKFWPGYLTVVLPASDLVSQIIKAEDLKINFQMPNNKIVLLLSEFSQTPIAYFSVNIPEKRTTSALQEIVANLKDEMDYVVIDDGKTEFDIVSSTILDFTGKTPIIIQEGAISAKELIAVLNSKHILFVCTGNTCRSFMAEKLFSKMIKEVNLAVEVSSAGTCAIDKGKVSTQALKILEEEGIKPDNPFSTLLTEKMIKKADLILTMENYHKERVLNILPSAKEKTFLLTEYVGLERKEIPDPIGSSREGYETCLIEIKRCLTRLIKRLME